MASRPTALSPRIAIGASLVVESAADRPASVALAKRGELSKLEIAAPTAAAAAAVGAAAVTDTDGQVVL